MVVRDLPGWPLSASALFDRLNERITRHRLLWIAESDPFGARAHFPILAGIRLSGRTPPSLEFDPGEALRLTRWDAEPNVDHVARAWSCALLVIAPGGTDELDEAAAQLVASCLALGDGLPDLAERLLAWRAVSEEPVVAAGLGTEPGPPDPVALLALMLLRVATDPGDPRLPDLIRTVADAAVARRESPAAWDAGLAGLMSTVSRRHWRALIDEILAPLRPAHPDVDRLVVALTSDG